MTLPAGWEGIDQNFLGLDEPWCHPDQAGVYVLPVPYEHTSSYVQGSDRGPSAIIEASQQVELYDETLRCEPYQGNPYSHASVMARVVDDGLPLVQVGIRSISPEEIDRIESTDRIDTFFAAEMLDPSGLYEGKASRWVPDIVKACRGPVYLTFDCAGLDASLVPALGTPEPGGLGWYDTVTLVTALANGPGIVGMDISEIAPIDGFVAPQFCIARLIYRMLGRIKAGRRVH